MGHGSLPEGGYLNFIAIDLRGRENSWWMKEREGENCMHGEGEGWEETLLSLLKPLH